MATFSALCICSSKLHLAYKFKHLQANCDSYRYSFFPATISSWNNLPFGIEKVDSVEGFKLKLKELAQSYRSSLSSYLASNNAQYHIIQK